MRLVGYLKRNAKGVSVNRTPKHGLPNRKYKNGVRVHLYVGVIKTLSRVGLSSVLQSPSA